MTEQARREYAAVMRSRYPTRRQAGARTTARRVLPDHGLSSQGGDPAAAGPAPGGPSQYSQFTICSPLRRMTRHTTSSRWGWTSTRIAPSV